MLMYYRCDRCCAVGAYKSLGEAMKCVLSFYKNVTSIKVEYLFKSFLGLKIKLLPQK
jgi:hypothetical protein